MGIVDDDVAASRDIVWLLHIHNLEGNPISREEIINFRLVSIFDYANRINGCSMLYCHFM